MNKLLNLPLAETDPLIADAIDNEVARQANGLELIASENFVSEAVLEAAGSVFTNKYAEGYPGKRYYGGCEWTDVVEQAAIDRAKELFAADHANVQPHSGAQANMSVYLAAIQYGDQILGMNLSHGGHLTHGHPLNFSGILYKVVPYGVKKDDERIDYDEMDRMAQEQKPRMIICGASAYSRVIDFKRIREICDRSGSRRPRVVTAGVPMRSPDAIIGFCVSKGIVFLLTVILAASSMFWPSFPVIPFENTSVMNRWLSVPPDTIRNPVSPTACKTRSCLSSIP